MKDERIRLLFAGDICLDRKYEELIKSNSKADLDGVKELFVNYDYVIGNLECPLSRNIKPITKSGPNLVANPNTIDLLSYVNINVVTLANNHILDQDAEGLRSTLELCNAKNIKTVGAGLNLKEASKVLYIEKNNQKIAVINAAEYEFSIAKNNSPGANPLEAIDIYYQIQEAKRNADLVIFVFHGGNEHYNLPNPPLVKMCRYICDIGADAVIGHHSHTVSGIEDYKGKPIIYSLGNFLFDRPSKESGWNDGIFFELVVNNKKIIENKVISFSQKQDKYGISIDDDSSKFEKKNEELLKIIKSDEKLKASWEEFLKQNELAYFYYMFNFNFVLRRFLKIKTLRRFLLRRKRLLLVLNMLRCASHRNALVTILENELKN